MKALILKINRTLFELETGILIFGAVCQLCVLPFKNRISYSYGLWIGILTALFSAWHMWRALDRGLELGEKGAPGYLGRQNVIRYVLIVAILIFTAVSRIGDPVAAFAGIMGLKVSAYMQPFTKKISKRIYGGEILPEGITENITETIIEEPAAGQEIRR